MNGYALDDIKDPKGEILVKKGETPEDLRGLAG